MRGVAALLLTTAALALGAPRAPAQDPVPVGPEPPAPSSRPARLVDVGVYVGGAWSTDWYETADEGFSPGTAPLAGVVASYWLSPTVGVRAHAGYMPSRVPEGDATFPDDDWAFNVWLYDVGLVWRPWGFRSDVGRFQGSAYFTGGVGGVTANRAGPAEGQTSLAATVGAGADVARLSDRVGLFGEVALYVYPGPVEESATVGARTALTTVGRFGVRLSW